MSVVRRIIANRPLAAMLLAATLLLKLLVPTGYMIGQAHGGITIEICSGVMPRTMVMPMTGAAPMAMSGMHGAMPGHGGSKDRDRADMPCPFAALSAAALGAIDSIRLAESAAFIVAAGFAPVDLPALVRHAYLRPPLRGPPAAP